MNYTRYDSCIYEITYYNITPNKRAQELRCGDCVNYLGCKNFFSKYLQCPYFCYDGACINKTEWCFDTNENNHDINGTITYFNITLNKTITFTDYCFDYNSSLRVYEYNYLHEYSCEGDKMREREIRCTWKCYRGICSKQPD